LSALARYEIRFSNFAKRSYDRAGSDPLDNQRYQKDYQNPDRGPKEPVKKFFCAQI
jgi:hypothetical protein